jgi:hypothetical protein
MILGFILCFSNNAPLYLDILRLIAILDNYHFPTEQDTSQSRQNLRTPTGSPWSSEWMTSLRDLDAEAIFFSFCCQLPDVEFPHDERGPGVDMGVYKIL